jgi:hypothetical protein
MIDQGTFHGKIFLEPSSKILESNFIEVYSITQI